MFKQKAKGLGLDQHCSCCLCWFFFCLLLSKIVIKQLMCTYKLNDPHSRVRATLSLQIRYMYVYSPSSSAKSIWQCLSVCLKTHISQTLTAVTTIFSKNMCYYCTQISFIYKTWQTAYRGVSLGSPNQIRNKFMFDLYVQQQSTK